MMVPVFTLRQGAKGQCTKILQKALGIEADGVFGAGTTVSLKAWQRAHGLADDGIAGPATLKAMGIPVPEFWVDVSHYQGAIDWGQVAASGVKGAVVKVTNGTAIDSKAIDNVSGANAARLPVMVYAYAKPDPSAGDARKEAGVLYQNSQGLPMVLDLEERNGMSGAQLAGWAAQWVDEVFTRTARWPTIYANADFISNVYTRGTELDKTRLAKCPLWLAQLTGDNDPSLPADSLWPTAQMLQYRWDGEVPGIKGKVDCNWRFA